MGSNSLKSRQRRSASAPHARKAPGSHSSSGPKQRSIPSAYAQNRTRRGRETSVTSVRLGDIKRDARAQRDARAHNRYRTYLMRIAITAGVLLCVLAAGFGLYLSPAFTIEKVEVEGVNHLTDNDMAALARVPAGTTLLRVDASGIEHSIERDAWVLDATIHRNFPSTLTIDITERTIAAVVEVPTQDASASESWAISSDGMWLMQIPSQDSSTGQMLNPTIYEDAANVLHIVGVPYGVRPSIGSYCTDESIINALEIVDGLTTELADQIKLVTATDAISTLLTLDDGVEIAFGTAENIREKELICLQIMEDNPGKVAYINVRVVDRPTWRAV